METEKILRGPPVPRRANPTISTVEPKKHNVSQRPKSVLNNSPKEVNLNSPKQNSPKEVNLNSNNSQNSNQNPLTRKFRAPTYHRSVHQKMFNKATRRNKNRMFGPTELTNHTRNTLLRRKARNQLLRKKGTKI